VNPSSTPSVKTSTARATQRDASLRLSMVAGIGPRIYGDLVEHFGSAELALAASPAELRSVQGVGQKLMRALVNANETIDVSPVLQQCEDNNIHVIDRAHESYPPLLTKIHDPPGVLFCRGDLQTVDQLSIAIVGTRHSTNYGDRVATNLAQALSMAGLTIVSGMARGIDAAAHRAALECGGRTIAVLGGGVMNIYPPEHKSLADSIAANGAVLSESLPNQAPRKGCFPRRNRIVTGMSLGVIVVEAGERSGASISARLAAEQGRDVFAVPGRIDSRMSRGSHKLIRDGATLVENVGDVLDQLGPLIKPLKLGGAKDAGEQTTVRHPAELKLSNQERKVLNYIETVSTDFDVIVEKTQLPPARILATISVLEIRRLIRRTSNTSFVRL